MCQGGLPCARGSCYEDVAAPRQQHAGDVDGGKAVDGEDEGADLLGGVGMTHLGVESQGVDDQERRFEEREFKKHGTTNDNVVKP